MVSGILRKLGIVMGDDINEANNEDRSFLIRGRFARGRSFDAIVW